MTREEINELNVVEPNCFENDREEEWYKVGLKEGLKVADKSMIESACKCFCDNLCEKSLCGMCFHKYDGENQIKNSFQYNECNELQLLRKEMEVIL